MDKKRQAIEHITTQLMSTSIIQFKKIFSEEELSWSTLTRRCSLCTEKMLRGIPWAVPPSSGLYKARHFGLIFGS